MIAYQIEGVLRKTILIIVWAEIQAGFSSICATAVPAHRMLFSPILYVYSSDWKNDLVDKSSPDSYECNRKRHTHCI